MKYFTKAWYKLMQGMDYTLCMRQIDDKDYTDAEIEALYKRRLAADIRRDRAAYNEPPSRIEIDFDEFDLDDFVEFDGNRLIRPTSMDEVKRKYEEEYLREKEAFESRPPFDPAETVKMFERMYAGGLEHGHSNFPDWIRDEVDIRLIALGYLPKSVYARLKVEQKRNRAEFNKIERAAQKALSKEAEKIPDELRKHFGFHDGDIFSLKNYGDDLIMTIKQDCAVFENETPYVRVTFIGGKIIERDDNIKFDHRKIEYDGTEYDAYCQWLYEELYKTPDGYEAHMLLAEGDLGYLTIECRDIKTEFNIEYAAD